MFWGPNIKRIFEPNFGEFWNQIPHVCGTKYQRFLRLRFLEPKTKVFATIHPTFLELYN